MEEIRLITNERIDRIKNSFGETNHEYIGEGCYKFYSGKVYGIVCEYGEGGEFISSILSNNISQEKEKIFVDGVLLNNYANCKIGWYMGCPIYKKGVICRELSVKKALLKAIRETGYIYNFNEILREFGLQERRINYKLSWYSYEKWRASLAIGYVFQKQIFCFPWMNSLTIYNTMKNSKVYTLFNKITERGGIIILPTSKKENIVNIVDYIIEINSKRFQNRI